MAHCQKLNELASGLPQGGVQSPTLLKFTSPRFHSPQKHTIHNITQWHNNHSISHQLSFEAQQLIQLLYTFIKSVNEPLLIIFM